MLTEGIEGVAFGSIKASKAAMNCRTPSYGRQPLALARGFTYAWHMDHATQPPSSDPHTRCAPTNGRLLIVAAALLWSTSGFFVKAPLLEFWSPQQRGIQLAFWRVLFACVLLLPMVRRPRWTWRLVPAGISFALMNVCFLMAMTTTTEANAIWLQYTAPALVLVVGVLFLGERAVRADYWMMALCLAGVCLIVFFECRVRGTTKLLGARGVLGAGFRSDICRRDSFHPSAAGSQQRLGGGRLSLVRSGSAGTDDHLPSRVAVGARARLGGRVRALPIGFTLPVVRTRHTHGLRS